VEKIQLSLKHDNNKGYFMPKRMYIYDSISLNSFSDVKYFRVLEKHKHSFHIQLFFPRKSCGEGAICMPDIEGKNTGT
jgi:hypothetical protein